MSREQARRLARSVFDEDERTPDACLDEGCVVDGYRIVSHVASGGTCDVFRAERDGANVALKVLKQSLPPELEWRVFEREVAALRGLDHPAIARLVGSGRVGASRAYLAIEFVEGSRLTSHACARSGASGSDLEPDAHVAAIVRIFAEICEGVDHAHRAGVIHRDLKPSNILVDGHGRPRIVDFGVSLPAHIHRWSEHGGWSGGTRPYMSPEQIALPAGDLDSRSDVFSLGVVLFQLLTDRRSFDIEGLTPEQALEGMRSRLALLAGEGFLRPPGRGPRGSRANQAALEPVVRKALALDRDLRYQAARELGEASLRAIGLG